MAETSTTTPSPTTTSAYWSVGKRKAAIARVKMLQGNGAMTINDQPIEVYCPNAMLRAKMLAPLVTVERLDTFDVSIKVMGGGPMGQLDAIALGLARALLEYDATLRPALKREGMLTRDARVKERKKYGLRRARKAPQYSKR